MSTTFAQMKFQPSLALRSVERIKRIKIQPHTTRIPFTLSITGGVIVVLLSLTIPSSPLFSLGRLIGSALPAKMQTVEVGLIPADMIDMAERTILSNERMDNDFGQKPHQQINQINDSIREKEGQKTGRKKVIIGAKPVPGDSTFIGTLHPMLKAAGGDWSIPRLSGTFGHAFSFQYENR